MISIGRRHYRGWRRLSVILSTLGGCITVLLMGFKRGGLFGIDAFSFNFFGEELWLWNLAGYAIEFLCGYLLTTACLFVIYLFFYYTIPWIVDGFKSDEPF